MRGYAEDIYILFDLPFVKRAKTVPENSAALIPAAVAATPPLSAPTNPFWATAACTPFAIV